MLAAFDQNFKINEPETRGVSINVGLHGNFAVNYSGYRNDPGLNIENRDSIDVAQESYFSIQIKGTPNYQYTLHYSPDGSQDIILSPDYYFIDTDVNYYVYTGSALDSSTTDAPTAAPTTAPTAAPTAAPTDAPAQAPAPSPAPSGRFSIYVKNEI